MTQRGLSGLSRLYHARSEILIVILFLLFGQAPSFAEEMNCLICHKALTEEKTVHMAVQMGCEICHAAVDASNVPHAVTNGKPKGLSMEQPDLCYTCHDKSKFTDKTIHAALFTGCTSCHNPHSSKNARLLVSEQTVLCATCHDKEIFSGTIMHAPVSIGICTGCHLPHASVHEKLLSKQPPDLCYTCHEQSEFSRQYVHMPVAGGLCLGCHRPHASEHDLLLANQPLDVCLECHSAITEYPHVLAGFAFGGHPLGKPKKIVKMTGNKKITEMKFPDDPARPGRKFYCGSCHFPHSAESPKLLRFGARSSTEMCKNCHEI